MTKQDLQKELKEKVIPGVKPSDFKKLKRSKSEGDIPKTPTSVPVKKSQSQLEIPLTQSNSKLSITQLQEQVKFHAETAANYLKSLQTSQAKVSKLETQLKTNPPSQLLQDQLQKKQQEIERLRQQLENKNTPADLSELDNSLIARHRSLKDWFIQYQQTKSLEQELAENIDEASTELITQDQTISQLREQNSKLKLTNQSLTKDLQLAQRLAESRKVPYYYSPEDNWANLKYVLYSLLAVAFTLWLTKSFKNIQENPNNYD